MTSFSELFGGGGGFELIQRDIFLTSGTWTKGADVLDTDTVVVDLWGGGSGGIYTNSITIMGTGGGGHNRLLLLSSAVTASVTVVVGSGGAAGTQLNQTNPASAAGPQKGGTSSFENYGYVTGGRYAYGGSFGGPSDYGYMPFIANTNPSYLSNGDKWRASKSDDSFPFAAHSNHGGAVGDRNFSATSKWGGAGSIGGNGSSAVPRYGTSLYGGDSGSFGNNTGVDGSAGQRPGGAGGTGFNTPAFDGGPGEARVYVVRGAIVDDEFIFEAV